MRRIGTASAFIAAVLLVRCGEADRPAATPRHPIFAPAQVVLPEPAQVAVAVSSGNEPVPTATAESLPVDEEPPAIRVRRLVGSLTGQHGSLDSAMAAEERASELMELGAAAFPDYQTILADPNSTAQEIAGVCDILDRLQTDPRRLASFVVRRGRSMPKDIAAVEIPRQFRPVVVRRLAAPDAMVSSDSSYEQWDRRQVRHAMVFLLGDIGDERDAWVLVPLLSDDDKQLGERAAEALAKIGGRRELEALNQWLIEQDPNDPMLPRMRKYRDQLESRLLARPSRRNF